MRFFTDPFSMPSRAAASSTETRSVWDSSTDRPPLGPDTSVTAYRSVQTSASTLNPLADRVENLRRQPRACGDEYAGRVFTHTFPARKYQGSGKWVSATLPP